MATYGKKGSKVKKTGYVSSSPGIERARQQLADHERAMADLKATKAKKTAKKTASSKTSTAADKRAANKKSADAKRAANAAKVAARNVKDAPTDTAERRSPDTYRPDVKVGGKNTFYGTNIPTAGYTSNEIADFNARLKEDVDAGNSRGANDVIFSIAHARGGGEGNKRVGAVQSGMWKLDKGNLWAEDNINSTNDRYVIRDEKGKPTGKEVRFSDQTGVVKGPPNEWKPIGSWGENARAGIVEGQPTAAPPPASNTFVPIVDLDTPGGRVIAGPGAGTRPGAGGGVQGPYSPGGYIPAGAGGYGGGGFLGGGGYPVMGMGTPSGLSYPAAAEAAEGYAGALGFNIGPEGGLVYRPWEARAWQQTGIDPNLWNAPFAGGGLLGGGYGGGQPGGGRPGAVPGAGVGGTGTTAGVNVPTTGGQVIPTTGGGLSLSGLGGLLGSWGRPTIGGGRVQGGNVQSVADINAQEIASGVDQFAVNQMALPSLLSGRAALPSASWTAPANPYGTQPGGYTTSAPGAFSNLVANTPIGTGRANYASDFYTPPSAVATVNPSIEPSIAAAMDAHYAGIPSQDTPYGAWGTGWSGRQALVPTATTATNPFDTGTAQIYGAEPIR